MTPATGRSFSINAILTVNSPVRAIYLWFRPMDQRANSGSTIPGSIWDLLPSSPGIGKPVSTKSLLNDRVSSLIRGG